MNFFEAARQRRLVREIEERTLDHGYQVVSVQADPGDLGSGFSYTVGRWTLLGRPELLMTGSVPPLTATSIMTGVGESLDALLEAGVVPLDGSEPIELEGLSVPVRVIEADPSSPPCSLAIVQGGARVRVIQLVWPDRDGDWPAPWGIGTDPEQPIHARRA